MGRPQRRKQLTKENDLLIVGGELKPAAWRRPIFVLAAGTASSREGASTWTAVAFRHTTMMSSWIGSFACAFGVATDISDLNGLRVQDDKAGIQHRFGERFPTFVA